jgi:hypothetical protein
MPQTYDAILEGDRVRWTDDAPDDDRPLRVRVTVLEDASDRTEQGEKMAEALSKLAETGAFSDVEDPRAWQKEMRRDRSLPGRDE